MVSWLPALSQNLGLILKPGNQEQGGEITCLVFGFVAFEFPPLPRHSSPAFLFLRLPFLAAGSLPGAGGAMLAIRRGT